MLTVAGQQRLCLFIKPVSFFFVDCIPQQIVFKPASVFVDAGSESVCFAAIRRYKKCSRNILARITQIRPHQTLRPYLPIWNACESEFRDLPEERSPHHFPLTAHLCPSWATSTRNNSACKRDMLMCTRLAARGVWNKSSLACFFEP